MSSPLISGGPLLRLRCSARVRHCLPPHVSEGGGLVCGSVVIVDLLSNHFDSKQSREAVDLQLTHLPSISKSYHLCHQVERGQASLVRLGPL